MSAAPPNIGGRGLTRHERRETVPDWAIAKFLRVCHRDTESLACVVPLYEDGSDFAFGASIEPGGIGFVAWMSDADDAKYRTVFEEARSACAAGLFMPLASQAPEFPVADGDAVIEVPVDDLIGPFGDRPFFRCVLFGVNSVAKARPGSEAYLPVKLRIPVANTPHVTLRRHRVAPAWQSACEDEAVDVDKDQKYVTFHRDVDVEEFTRGTRVTLDQPIVFFAKRERRFHMSVVSAATFSYGSSSLWEARDWGCASVDSGDPLVVSYFGGRLVLSSIQFEVWIVRGWYLEPYGRREAPPADEGFFWGSFRTPFVEVGAARRIQRFWRKLRCDPHHPVGNRLLRRDFEKAG